MRLGRNTWLGLLAALLVAAAAAVWLLVSGFPLMDRFQFDCNNTLKPMAEGHELVQTFVAPEDGLSRVDLRFYENDTVGEQDLVFELWDVLGSNPDGTPVLGEKIRESRVSSRDVALFWMHRFEFEPVADSQGKTYAMRITSSAPDGAALRLRASNKDVYDGGAVFQDGKVEDADLSFVLFHEAGVWQALDRISPFRPFPLNSAGLFVAVFLLAAAAFGWLLWYIAGGFSADTATSSDSRSHDSSRSCGDEPPPGGPEGGIGG
ncbi:MAG: hypothetical protein WC828_02685 [Thermoleophilia bacterium]|jgi:hypothetical protein